MDLAPCITWLDSSPRRHTSEHTSACAGCMCQLEWRKGPGPGPGALGGNREQQHNIAFLFFFGFTFLLGVVHC